MLQHPAPAPPVIRGIAGTVALAANRAVGQQGLDRDVSQFRQTSVDTHCNKVEGGVVFRYRSIYCLI